MALLTRVTRLFHADIHSLLDQIEEPEAVLRQAVREMEESLARERARTKLLEHERSRLDERAREVSRVQERTSEELDACFEAGSDDLARGLVRRRLEAERLEGTLARRRESLDAELRTLADHIAANESRLEGMRQKAAVLAEEMPAPGTDPLGGGADLSVSADDVEIAFLREKRNRGNR